MKSKFFLIILTVIALFLFGLLPLFWLQQPVQAQGGDEVTLTKVLNRSNPIIRVGEVISFDITLVNNASFTLTHVTLFDEYNIGTTGPNGALVFAGAIPPVDVHDATNWALTWTNVASPVIPPGGILQFTVFFTAIHPQTALVNRAEARDITGTQSALSNSEATDDSGSSIGGSAPVFKALNPPGQTIASNQPVTFTHLITNDGAALMTFLPLTDTYDPAYLEFHFALPTPTLTTPGQLVWSDLTTYFGALPPFGSIVVTTVFTATGQPAQTANQASTQGARDEYNNDLAAGQAQVPITIIDETTTEDDDEVEEDNDDDDGASSVGTVVVQSTPATMAELSATGTETSTTAGNTNDVPLYLPETGGVSPPFYILAGLICYLMAGGIFLFRGQKPK